MKKIKMNGEVQRYTIQAHDDRYFILTKPMNAMKSYIYCIVDLERKVRSTDNLVFGSFREYNTKEGAEENLKMLQKGEMELSRRKEKRLEPEEVRQFIS